MEKELIFRDDFDLLIAGFKGLGNEFRYDLFTNLAKVDALSLTSIQKMVEKPTGYLVKNIHDLELAGLLSNYLKRMPNTKEYSFYRLTAYARNVFLTISAYLAKNFTELTPYKIFRVLGNKIRFEMVILLMNHEMSFTEIRDNFLAHPESIGNHLRKLFDIDMIQNFIKKDQSNLDYSFYKLSISGEHFFQKIISVHNEYLISCKTTT